MDANNNSNMRGREYEEIIGDLLNCLCKRYLGNTETTTGTIEVKRHVEIKLHNSEVVIPDYELVCRLDHIRESYLIECQDRKRSSMDIVHKNRHIKSLSSKNVFVFVYKDDNYLSMAIRESLKNDGIIHYSLKEFIVFLSQLNNTMAKLNGRTYLNLECSLFQNEVKKIITERPSLMNSKDTCPVYSKEELMKQPVKDNGMLGTVR
jgi:hypothetical protein